MQQIATGWVPQLPLEARDYFGKIAYLPNTPNLIALDEARDSVNVFIPKVLEVLRKRQGERYYLNVSESRGRLFYFFAPRHPVDTFTLTLGVEDTQAFLSFGFVPYKVNHTLDFQGMLSAEATVEPELAGLALMRLVRTVISKIR